MTQLLTISKCSIQEALNYLDNVQVDMKSIESMCEASDLIETCKKALEKQIPKKPILHQYYEYEEDGVQSDYSYYTCANRCHKYCQVNPQDGFCRKCGQAIDWGDE